MTTGASRAVSSIGLAVAAIFGGLLVGMTAANVWPLLLFGAKLRVPAAAAIEVAFLAVYVWILAGWASGPFKQQRLRFGRGHPPSGAQWGWGLLAALAFAVTVHAAIVVLFRLIPFPARAFHQGYDLSTIPTLALQWLACIISALSAGVCEEMGFRGYMQKPLEDRFGPLLAILISATMFMLLHLNKSWALMAMTPIIFGAGVLLGVLARASGTLLFCMLGHWAMDIGLFAYWWTQIAGAFSQRPVSETGVEATFLVELGVLGLAVAAFWFAVARLGAMRRPV